MYQIDGLSFSLGRFEWDAYLISRGVRILGDHHFKIEDFNKIKSHIEEIANREGVKTMINYHGKGNDIKVVEVIIYHQQKGQDALRKLKELDELSRKAEESLDPSILQKIIKDRELTEEEKNAQKKLKKAWDHLEIEYGKLYGYDDSSIKEHMDKLNKQ